MVQNTLLYRYYVSWNSLLKVEIMHNESYNIAFKYNSIINSHLVKNSNQHNNKTGVYPVPCENCNLVYMKNATFCHATENDHKILWGEI